ncbi:hypothetical protein I4U23_011724 [Adineta vaga]|nr:hypothetical protein I4U23_011724 [Adineta vaga]
MSTPTTPKSPCSTCNKIAGVFICRGCEKDFCMRHANEHRQELEMQIDELSLDHDQIRQHLTEESNGNSYGNIFEQIDQWEQESVDKIHQNANEIRTEITNLLCKRMKNLSIILTNLTGNIKQSRDNDDYFERDILEWKKKLNQLKNDLFKTKLIDIQPIDNSIRIIPKFLVTILDENFIDQVSEYIRIEENGRAIVYNHQTSVHAGARAQHEYSWGQHRIRFQIEALNANKWIFCGIISKDIPFTDVCHSSSSSYGWTSTSQVIINGKVHTGYKNYKSDIELDDTMEFIIDCDRQKIRLRNERTRNMFELNIDLNQCPFPWKLQFNLHYPNDRIRLLSP